MMTYFYGMVNLGTAKLALVVMTMSIVVIAGTNLAFAEQQPCGAQAYAYVGCTPKDTAQLYGAVLVAGVVALAIAVGAAGRHLHTIP